MLDLLALAGLAQLGGFIWLRGERTSTAARVARQALREGRGVVWVGAPRLQHRVPPWFVVVDLDADCGAHVVGSVLEEATWEHARELAGPRPLVVFSHVLEHVSDPAAALAHARRTSGEEPIVLYPPVWWAGAWLVPGHSWLMGRNREGWWFRPNPLGQGADRPGTYGTRR